MPSREAERARGCTRSAWQRGEAEAEHHGERRARSTRSVRSPSQQRVVRPGDRGAREQQDQRVEERQVPTGRTVCDALRRPGMCARSRRSGTERSVEERPEEGDEEHHLRGDEQHHAVAQAELHDRRCGGPDVGLAASRRATSRTWCQHDRRSRRCRAMSPAHELRACSMTPPHGQHAAPRSRRRSATGSDRPDGRDAWLDSCPSRGVPAHACRMAVLRSPNCARQVRDRRPTRSPPPASLLRRRLASEEGVGQRDHGNVARSRSAQIAGSTKNDDRHLARAAAAPASARRSRSRRSCRNTARP